MYDTVKGNSKHFSFKLKLNFQMSASLNLMNRTLIYNALGLFYNRYEK